MSRLRVSLVAGGVRRWRVGIERWDRLALVRGTGTHCGVTLWLGWFGVDVSWVSHES